jgi:hypothetical protein
VTEKLEQQSHSDVQISWNDWRLQMHQFYQKAFGIYLIIANFFKTHEFLIIKLIFRQCLTYDSKLTLKAKLMPTVLL